MKWSCGRHVLFGNVIGREIVCIKSFYPPLYEYVHFPRENLMQYITEYHIMPPDDFMISRRGSLARAAAVVTD